MNLFVSSIEGWEFSEENQSTSIKHRIKVLSNWQRIMQPKDQDKLIKRRRYNQTNLNKEDRTIKQKQSLLCLPPIDSEQSKLLSFNTLDFDTTNKNRHRLGRGRKLAQFSKIVSKGSKGKKSEQNVRKQRQNQSKVRRKRLSPAVKKMYVQFKGREEMNSLTQKILRNFLSEKKSIVFGQSRIFEHPKANSISISN